MTRRMMFWRMVLSSIVRRRSRVLIAVLAVAIGATTLSGLATIATEVPAQLAREVRAYGANMVVSPESGSQALDPELLDQVSKIVPASALVGSAAFDYEVVLVNDQPFVAAGVELDAVRQMNPYWYVDGQWPTQPGQILVGEEVADTVGASVGKTITLTLVNDSASPAQSAPQSGATNSSSPASPQSGTAAGPLAQIASSQPHKDFTVVGILKTGGNEDSYMYASGQDISGLTGRGIRPSVAEYSIAVEADILDGIVADINAQVDAVNAQPVKRLAQSDSGVISMLRSLLAIIAGIVLVLTLIGVSTTMVAIVAERRNEIGLRKALGATSRSITAEFIGEGALLGLVGGVVGVALGYTLAASISLNVFHRSISLPPLIGVVTLLASVGVAVLACLPPVRRAAAVDPALVLRGE
ncbi:FtsX-like permease family protein [Schaalia sp. 19OD2882]|uniref:ABC transporter permease n=1 Tax=Schaalia sp. 19OD2882 TaxID=2794089 RepID=UPI001C1EC219|nr:FtsX-like permease family protein [Schaalia sp. 19OD2882]QWW19844.1 FtsX-like permease family protein [Schaalia sp. 19OD2882]